MESAWKSSYFSCKLHLIHPGKRTWGSKSDVVLKMRLPRTSSVISLPVVSNILRAPSVSLIEEDIS